MTGSHIGKTIYVAEALPATNDAAGFAALTWVKANGVQTLPQLGVSHNNIDVPDLQTGFTAGIKGAGSGNDSTATFRMVAADAGQADIRGLANAGGTLGAGSIKIVKGSGAAQAPVAGDPVQYAQGYFHSYIEIQGDDTSHEGFSVNFKQNALTVDATEPA
ncbi:hypothetical protein IP68_12445 [Blastomonas sp. AAP25]|uniref:hypothetical protein n=1 Tax=Blastomonas sp. AAP25 TaxID=1523416 RepID=UPI0006B90429|nr:hypothetical protein [Blastomonas sp. AAP25]KPF74564.1 hypothetical protein IP68_12445 [Blastomonas sp. AAP25]